MTRAIALVLALSGVAFAGEPSDGGAGAEISVNVEDNGDSTLAVHSGTVQVKAGNAKTRVSAEQSVRVPKGGKLEKRSLLPAPQPTAPNDGDRLNASDVTFEWAKVARVSRYRLVVTASTKEPAESQATATADARATLKVGAGTWYWRVIPYDHDGLEGKASPWRKLVIDLTPPALKTGKPRWK